jgi:hypothetical protein
MLYVDPEKEKRNTIYGGARNDSFTPRQLKNSVL